ncbi:NADH-quinone oxidoreductase subunit L [Cohaesibacter celericrescens]|uniref:NADH-ubiquinone oxidoreductase chain 5 n=1 Tax=Cohaesibacter celericrescens TaxID=2067669 RepID=A0A2N5XSH5_9HYPH|nr:NADH-quinone oxidoreductase subunit L [Cohaesibacter celericrescens]PLW77476.1 NADH-quinone oxidoreductase subunit L [Cohaesibacter celericrescens]
MYSAIVFLPLFGFLIAGLFGRSIGHRSAETITSGLVILAALLSWIAFLSIAIGQTEPQIVPVMSWIHSGTLSIDWTIRVDALTAVMLVVVNTVSAVVHVYSIGYMHDDPHRARFFAYLSLFTFTMLSLVTADNLLQMFFGWEGVGLASYLLIGFWYQKPSANAAAMKAFIVNRVGDFGFLLGICGIYVLFDTTSFADIFSAAPSMADKTIVFLGHEWSAMTTVCLLLFMGAMGKSAQFLLHTWLPDAMEGPTPVSALIHAATMVTAGVFMVARLSPLFELSPTALEVVTFVGATTAFFAATVGLVQNDIKRVIAYSTCSQLGYMFVALGIGAYGAAIFHLFTHAFFKALLFLGAGSVIHSVSNEQDMRRMGGLAKHIKVTYWMMMIGTLALTGVGIPGTIIGFAGFNSKDAIIESAYAAHNAVSGYAFGMVVIAALFTSFYSWRLIFMTFHGKERMSADVKAHIHESPKVMILPLMLLAVGAVFAGMVFSGYFFGEHYDAFWNGTLFTSEENHILHAFHDVPWAVKLAPFVMMLIGLVTAYIFYIRAPNLPKRLAARHTWLYKFLLNKWYFDEIYDVLFVQSAKKLGALLWKRGDEQVIDRFGPNGIAARVMGMTNRIVRLQTGYLYHYAFAMMIGVALIITYTMLSGGAH